MKNLSLAAIALSLVLVSVACERPNSPDFKLEHKVHAPVLLERSLVFLGGNSDALIDTTGSNFDSLFSTQSNDLIRLSKEKSFDFGNLDEALPEITVNSSTLSTELGEIGLTDFSSQPEGANHGSAGFQQITGLNAGLYSIGNPIPPGMTPGTVNIDLDTDYFVSATLSRNGRLNLTINNDLGFHIDGGLDITLKAGSTPLDNATQNVQHNSSATFVFDLSEGDVLQDLNIDVSASWTGQTMQDNPDDLIVEEIRGENLFASQVEAAISSQDFMGAGTLDVDNSEFQFTDPDHYIELESGQLSIDQITNNIDVGLDQLQISFPGLRNKPYTPADSLVVSFEGASKITRAGNMTSSPDKHVDLSGLRIYAENNKIVYNVLGITESTQDNSGLIRTFNQGDNLTAKIGISNLEIKKVRGVVLPRVVTLNNDDPGNGVDVLDLSNEQEAEIFDIDAFNDLSDKLDGIEFTNPRMSFNYKSNLGIASTIFAAIVGTDAKGEKIFLRGLPGSSYEVNPGEVNGTFKLNGSPVSSEQLIKFPVTTAGEGEIVVEGVQLEREETNVDDFLNNLPSDIRFVGVTKINDAMQTGTVSTPVRFEPTMSVDLPLNFSAANASYSDTVEADLSDLPDPENDEQQLTEASIIVRYTNALPFGLTISLIMQDEQGDEVTRIPLPAEDPLTVKAAQVGNDEFVSGENQGNMTVSLNREQLNRINRTRQMRVEISFNTTNQNSVKVRASDSISLGVSLKAAVESTVN